MKKVLSISMAIANKFTRNAANPLLHSSKISTLANKSFQICRYGSTNLLRFHCTKATQQQTFLNQTEDCNFLHMHSDNSIYLLIRDVVNGVLVDAHVVTFALPYADLSSLAKSKSRLLALLGSSNGLVCWAYNHDDLIYVCNPVYGDYLKLPKAGKNAFRAINFGFGFDEAANDYKLIRMFSESMSSFKSEAEIYTIGLGQWRMFGDVPFPLRRGNCTQVFLKGALHWMIDGVIGLGFSDFIVSFDVTREEFDLVPTPPNLVASWKNGTLYLRELGGWLCLVDYSSEDRCELWVMKDYGVKSSWTKEYVIFEEFDGKRFWPFSLGKNGMVIMHVCQDDGDDNIVAYDPVSKNLLGEMPPHGLSLEAINHVRSFISLKDVVGPSSGSVRRMRKTWDKHY